VEVDATSFAVSPIFMSGMMRSGTSLLRTILGKHPSIFAGLETHWFSEEFQTRWDDPTEKRMRWTRELFDIDEHMWRELISSAVDATDFLARMMAYCTKRVGKSRWAEKTPDNILHVRAIWEKWPTSPILHIRRDPRDCFASWKLQKNAQFEAFEAQWRAHEHALTQLTQDQSAKVLHLQYEDLIEQTATTLQKVCDFIDERFAPDMVAYEGDSTDLERVLRVTGKHSTTAEALARPIFSSSIGRWKRDLSAEEVSRIEDLMPGGIIDR
jgi:hypothetical protein